MVRKYNSSGLKLQKGQEITGVSKAQLYYSPTGKRPGKNPSQATIREVDGEACIESNQEMINKVIAIQSDEETDYGYHKMCAALMMIGYTINHKKLYRLMKSSNLLKEKHKKKTKEYAKYRIVTPEKPLTLMEMDIKSVWTAELRRNAYTLTIIDTFTRVVLYRTTGYTMKATQVKAAWEYVIINYLQPADMKAQDIHIEIRNDNGPQFVAKIIQELFKVNGLNQVFTHPYTPQENGHIESFHSILSLALKGKAFWNLQDLEGFLEPFYEKYNKIRLHSSIANLPPVCFWNLWEMGHIKRTVLQNKKVKFKLLIPYQKLSGIENLREVPCLSSNDLDEHLNFHFEASGPEALLQPSVHRSPSVVPC